MRGHWWSAFGPWLRWPSTISPRGPENDGVSILIGHELKHKRYFQISCKSWQSIVNRKRFLKRENSCGDRTVYVCICNAFTEKQVCVALSNGISSPADVFRHLGCAPKCGKCVPTVRCMVEHNDDLLVAPTYQGHNQHDELQVVA
ncbi:(2Fe-2S)-binding protein [Skermanella stibiiresistens]|uniref:(2Fe-2S)-binding protein n=1 Tax=Skermanella stibiiresistens TaxID=913326 RepID=UPI001FDFA2A7|nr:(2Fe-2S)-binding protein [Skermanella stibiiresistens]